MRRRLYRMPEDVRAGRHRVRRRRRSACTGRRVVARVIESGLEIDAGEIWMRRAPTSAPASVRAAVAERTGASPATLPDRGDPRPPRDARYPHGHPRTELSPARRQNRDTERAPRPDLPRPSRASAHCQGPRRRASASRLIRDDHRGPTARLPLQRRSHIPPRRPVTGTSPVDPAGMDHREAAASGALHTSSAGPTSGPLERVTRSNPKDGAAGSDVGEASDRQIRAGAEAPRWTGISRRAGSCSAECQAVDRTAGPPRIRGRCRRVGRGRGRR